VGKSSPGTRAAALDLDADEAGMIVFSVNMDTVNGRSSASDGATQQYARGEVILHTIEQLLGDPEVDKRINRDRIGLIGHSMGGEGVVVAQLLNDSQGRGFGITGVVSIAPTRWRPEVELRGTKYLQLLGSLDQLTAARRLPGRDAGIRCHRPPVRDPAVHRPPVRPRPGRRPRDRALTRVSALGDSTLDLDSLSVTCHGAGAVDVLRRWALVDSITIGRGSESLLWPRLDRLLSCRNLGLFRHERGGAAPLISPQSGFKQVM